MMNGKQPVGKAERARALDGNMQTARYGGISQIVAVAPFTSASDTDILAFIARQKSALVILPGYSSNMPSPEAIKRKLREGTIVFVEKRDRNGENIPCIVSAPQISTMPRQIFAQRPSAQQVDNLSMILQQRTIRVRERQLTFILCGEINTFNPDGTAKYGRDLAHDIVINPCHTTMGHWNFLGPKFTAISRRSLAVHVANNDHERPGITTDVRIYRAGRDVTRRGVEGRIAWSECEFPPGGPRH